jgi:predicted nucleic acid-binding protein
LILYVDTSAVIAVLTREAGSAKVEAWLQSQAPDELAISEWVVTEVSSALSLKLRTRQISPEVRADALAIFSRIAAESFQILPVSGAHFRVAAQFADREALAIRAADALHLAICATNGASLCTLDRRMAHAAQELGLRATVL